MSTSIMRPLSGQGKRARIHARRHLHMHRVTQPFQHSSQGPVVSAEDECKRLQIWPATVFTKPQEFDSPGIHSWRFASAQLQDSGQLQDVAQGRT